MISGWFETFGRSVVRHRLWFSLVLFFMTAAAISGIVNRLKTGTPVDFTPQAMFMGEGGIWDRLQQYEAEFGVEDNTVVVLVEGAIGTQEGLHLLRELHETAEVQAGVISVDSVINAAFADRDAAGMIVVKDAIGEEDGTLNRAAQDPFLVPLLLNTSQTAAAIQVHVRDDLQQISDLAPVVKGIRDALQTVNVPSDFKVHITGIPFVRTEVVDLMIEDELFFFPVVTTMFLFTIVALFRRFWLGVAPLVGVLLATIWAMGVILYSGAVLNILSVLAPTLILVIGVADGIHLTSRYREELARDHDRAQAMGRTMRHMTLACFLTTFTTAAGFASLLVAETKVIRDFGGQVAAGVMVTYLAVILVVPTLLAWLPVKQVGRPNDTVDHPLYDKLAALIHHKPWRILVSSVLLTLLVGFLGRNVQSNSAMLEMYREGHPTWTAVHTAEEALGGVIPMFIHLSGDEGQMLEPDILEKTAELETHLGRQELIGWSMSSASWVKHFHHLLTGESVWPPSKEAAAQEILLAEMSGELPIDKVLSHDRARARIVAVASDAGGRAFLAAKSNVVQEAERIFAGTGVEVEVTGDGVLASEGVDQLIQDLLASLALVFAVILVTMLILLRNLRLTIIATLPNLVPLMFILGTLGIMGADLQTSNIISFTIAVGLAVDDTIHFIVRYREEKRLGKSTQEAIRLTINGAGHAIVLTSILLVFGFSVLVFSPLTSTYFFGLLACITMAAALFGDLLILPTMLHLFDTKHTA